MYSEVQKWLDDALDQPIPDGTAGFVFNLYEDGDDLWSLELVATSRFDENDPDWGCDELTDLGTRENPLSWIEDAGWEAIQQEAADALSEYLSGGKYADVLKKADGVGVGFVDGELELLYVRQ